MLFVFGLLLIASHLKLKQAPFDVDLMLFEVERIGQLAQASRPYWLTSK
jgi:hypothetical protein